MHRVARLLSLVLALVAVAVAGAVGSTRAASAAASDVVVSQLYAGGGNTGATYQNDFVELLNRGSAPVDLGGYTVQYASAASTSWQATPLTGTLAPTDVAKVG